MSIRLSLLAILDQGPCYGYQLRVELERRMGGTLPINGGQVYATLDRLEKGGSTRVVETDDEGHVVSAITEQGHAEVAAWLREPVDQTAQRNELATKLALAITLPGVDVASIVQRQRHATMQHMQELTRLKHEASAATDLAWTLILDSTLFSIEAEARWLDHCESRIARARSMGESLSFPIATDLPKRGRPAGQSMQSIQNSQSTPSREGAAS